LIEADLQRYYGIDLRDPSLGVRRIRALLHGLPRDSALMRHEHGPTADWGNAEELLALVAELVHSSIRVQAKPGSVKPLRIPRPYEQTRPNRQATPAEMAAFLGRTTRGTK
jgi:hypothetical protein